MNKDKINWLLGISLGIIFLIAWIHIVDWHEFVSYFEEFRLTYVVFFSIFYIIAYFFRSWRWKIIMKPIFKMTFYESFRLFMTGLMVNYLIPVRAGELSKSLILKNKHNVRISKSLPTVFLDKITDLFPIIIIMILIPQISIQLNVTLKLIISALLLIFLLFIGFLFFAVSHKKKATSFLHSLLKILPLKYRRKLEDFFTNFVEGMGIMRNRIADNIKVYLLTILAVFSEAIYIYAVFHAFGSTISYPKILFGYTLMNLTYILPTPPAQIGSNQFMWVLIFGYALGANENLTSAAVTFSHLLTTIWIFLIGVISLITLKLNFYEIVKLKNNEVI